MWVASNIFLTIQDELSLYPLPYSPAFERQTKSDTETRFKIIVTFNLSSYYLILKEKYLFCSRCPRLEASLSLGEAESSGSIGIG